MTEEQIVKALECCIKDDYDKGCTECPIHCYKGCDFHLAKFALDLINRQKAEIERLKAELKEAYGEIEKLEDNIDNGVSVCAECHRKYAEEIKTAKIEAILEFSERLAKSIRSQLGISTLEKTEAYYFCLDELCNLTDSMTEDKDEN